MDINTEWAFEQYERVRDTLPTADFSVTPERIDSLLDIADRFDAFLLDAFGVLNVGGNPVPGAPETVAALQAAGKHVVVLTNGAGAPTRMSVEKYRKLGYDFTRENVVSSRDAMVAGLAARPEENWGVMAAGFSELDSFPHTCRQLQDDDEIYDWADGFALLTILEWNEDRQARLLRALEKRPRPVIVGNPDIIAPQEAKFSLEPGWYAHEIARETGIAPAFYGKPFGNVFDIALAKLDPAISKNRIAMVGDTLHTDVLGGRAAGLQTVLITDHGLFKGRDVDGFIETSGIIPNFIARTT